MDATRTKPTVFVSSTCLDLKQIREDVKEFLDSNYGFNTILSEFESFPIDPCVGTFENCLRNVDELAEIFILIIGSRYGYVTDKGKSITNLEYLHAKAKRIPIYVFVSKQVYNTLPLWRANKEGDYSSVVDDPRIFEFVSEIYDESQQWVYTYDTVRDIKMTLKQQLAFVFSEGLAFKKLTKDPEYKVLYGDLPPKAARALIEKPYAWEYKFFAYVIKNEFNKLQKHRWDFKYGIFSGHVFERNPEALIDDISEKLNEILKLANIMGVLVNSAIQDAIGAPGIPSDLEMIIYASKQFAAIYERMIAWALYFKSLHTDAMFDRLLELLYELPKTLLDEMDEFVDHIYSEITSIPDVDDHAQRTIKVSCELSEANAKEINEEILKINEYLRSKRQN